MAGKQILRQGTHITENEMQIVRRTGTYSHVNWQLYKEEAAKEIKAPPSFYTRRQDGQPLPAVHIYCQAYDKLMTCTLTTTVTTAFNFTVLNRTVWTGKKQALSGNAGGAGRMNQSQQVHAIYAMHWKTLHTFLLIATNIVIAYGNASTDTSQSHAECTILQMA
jgi:hypothetical protein